MANRLLLYCPIAVKPNEMTNHDTEISALLSSDPRRGFDKLVESYQDRIYWHIRRMVVGHDDAQDLTQDTFVRAYRGLKGFRGDSAVGTWIYRIATNEALRFLEAEARRNTVPLDESFDRAADQYVDLGDSLAVKLQQAVHTLPPKQQLTFNLRYFDNMDYDRIAQITDTTPTAAKANYHYAKQRIEQLMTH